MPEWWTYSLSDFLLFSDRVYFRLFELHNRTLWPAHLLTTAFGLAVLGALIAPTRTRGRLALTTLGGLWLWIAWAFFWQRYATINWAAPYVAPVFALQGLALIAGGVTGKIGFTPRRGPVGIAGTSLFVAALAGYPLLAPLLGRPWTAAEVFGIAPDPTAVATLAVLAVAGGALRWTLFLVPSLWCIVTTATLWTMGADDFLVAPAAALTAIAISLLLHRGPAPDTPVRLPE